MRGLNDHPAPGGRGGIYSHVLTGRGPHRRFEHLLTDGAVEIIFGVGSGRREILGHGGVGNQGGGSRRGGGGGGGPRPDSLREPGGGGEPRQEAARARGGGDRAGRGRTPRRYGRTRRTGLSPGLLLPLGRDGKAVPGGRQRWRKQRLASLSLLQRFGACAAPPFWPGKRGRSPPPGLPQEAMPVLGSWTRTRLRPYFFTSRLVAFSLAFWLPLPTFTPRPWPTQSSGSPPQPTLSRGCLPRRLVDAHVGSPEPHG